jgi:hypothetical protein
LGFFLLKIRVITKKKLNLSIMSKQNVIDLN